MGGFASLGFVVSGAVGATLTLSGPVTLPVQQNTHFPCIRPTPPYLNHSLNSVNLRLMCNGLSEKSLHRITATLAFTDMA